MIETVEHKGYKFEVRSGKDAFYGVSGRAWVAIGPDPVVVCMGQCPYVSIDAGIRLAGVTRRCKSARRAQSMESKRIFGEFRLAARDYLSKFGNIQSGIISSGEFVSFYTMGKDY